MGKTNRTASLEKKISLLLGEQEKLKEQIERAQALVKDMPTWQERLWEISELVRACSAIIKSDHPDWTPYHLKGQRPFVHKIPIRLGSATKTGLDVLRLAAEPMTIREIAREVLKREGLETWTTETLDKVANTIGNGFRKRDRAYLQHDGGWPARWSAVKSE